ncbi:MAG TPA: GlsB/YeaQ/YmgE family stress response membrane protein [Candidatus Saccharimonadales bacterium]|nr:GlsB/YeaQ/YmgE family stress response membrane protein [Candidatus Saccharimonadales bacterium]
MTAMLLSMFLESRVVVVEDRRGLIGWLIIGLLAGWLAGKLARGEGYGCITDIILGLIGSVLGGWIFTRLGIFGGGFLYSLAAATLGAVILVSIVHLFVGSKN